jgi:predicted YcjX-like family ATPase
MDAFTLASVHSSTPSRVSQGKTPTKIIKSRAIKGKEKSPWRVPSSSPVVQKKKLKAKHRRIISRRWLTNRTGEILIKMMALTAVNSVRNTTMLQKRNATG